ncbi:Bardet-Biedl syndrome 4 [Homo sapiens]|uniref:Bardet-Biedl syndrome 4 n=1 Tax=Homo sapiens TaxID=9606 RepID=H3BUQ7_HUMAN|nr:Bardet-Biedl syndrome 4 [Homo sapiens]KAI4058611.1 Bardet-Biedl syndrome 4 [Homo sapiens]
MAEERVATDCSPSWGALDGEGRLFTSNGSYRSAIFFCLGGLEENSISCIY